VRALRIESFNLTLLAAEPRSYLQPAQVRVRAVSNYAVSSPVVSRKVAFVASNHDLTLTF
jgi:hypothetical protein